VPADVRLVLLAKAMAQPARVRVLRLLASRLSWVTFEMVAHFHLAR
jgi:hypothetical protein